MYKLYAVLLGVAALLIAGITDISEAQSIQNTSKTTSISMQKDTKTRTTPSIPTHRVQTIRVTPSIPTQNIASQNMPENLKDLMSGAMEENTSEFNEEDENVGTDEQSIPAAEETKIDESLSAFEQYLSGEIPVTVSTDIKQFGYDLFGNSAGAYSPAINLPASSDYIIGPDDQIIISIWGKVEGKWDVMVDRDGNITLPKTGTIAVTGLSFSELKTYLQKEFSKYYTGFQINVSMGALRSIRVYIVGNAKQPGAYTVSSLSTLVSALFQAGGPGKSGSMRDIQLKRNGTVITHLDLYDFILKGDKTDDKRLMSEDVIFIPAVGSLAGIAGQVTVPAIYELKGDTSITDLIEMAGGINGTGYLQKVQLERVDKNTVKKLIDTNINTISANSDITLQDRDIVKIFPISNIITNAVNVIGNVMRPGQYQWTENMKVSDLFKQPETDLLPETYYRHAMIERYISPDYHKEIISFNLGRALFEANPEDNIQLLPYDTLTIYSKWDYEDQPVAHITGAVNKPDMYELTPNMKISDLIKLAGGTKRYAFTETAELTRVTITQDGPKTEKITLNLQEAILENPEHNEILQEDDFLFIRTVPEWKLYETVSIEGEVRFPGMYTIAKGDKLSSLIERAGGYTDQAYLRASVFTRESIREIQQQNLTQMVDRLERELILATTADISTAVSGVEVRSKEVEFQQQKAVVESLRKIKATGRISMRLTHLRLLKNSDSDIELKEGDVLIIPRKNNMINVIGSVISNGSFVYSDSYDFDDYISKSGGFTKNADGKNSYVLKADGSAMELNNGLFNWNKNKSRWAIAGFDEETRLIEPGDTIVVPEKLERIAWLREIKDFTQILYQIAVTAGVVINVL